MATIFTYRVPSGATADATKRITGVAGIDATKRITVAPTIAATQRVGETVFAELTLLMETGVDFLLEGGTALVLE